ncbi:hypothetical protein FOXYSP1_15975 [Fusarium oxysporum f. sp. phaseoli]
MHRTRQPVVPPVRCALFVIECRLALCCRLRPTEAIHLQPPSGNDHARDGSNLASLCTTCQKD